MGKALEAIGELMEWEMAFFNLIRCAIDDTATGLRDDDDIDRALRRLEYLSDAIRRHEDQLSAGAYDCEGAVT
jgi:hypothetical protein